MKDLQFGHKMKLKDFGEWSEAAKLLFTKNMWSSLENLKDSENLKNSKKFGKFIKNEKFEIFEKFGKNSEKIEVWCPYGSILTLGKWHL